jgi:outer membrane protein assembly factor BamB
LFLDSNGLVYAVDPDAAKGPGGRPIQDPAIITALDPSTLQVRRHLTVPASFGALAPLAAVGHDLVLRSLDHGGEVIHVDAMTGQFRTLQLPAGILQDGSPSIVSGLTTLISDRDDGQVTAVDLGTGTIQWSVATGIESPGAALASGGSLYLLSRDGRIVCLDQHTGASRWMSAQRRDPAATILPMPDPAPPALVDGNLYAGASTHAPTVFGITPPVPPNRKSREGH